MGLNAIGAGPLVSLFLLIIITASAVPPLVSTAYEKDTHYYLTFFLAVATCFEPYEALLIAGGDLSVDKDSDVYPMPTGGDVKDLDFRRYRDALKRQHAMGSKEEIEPIISRMKTSAHEAFRVSGPQDNVLVSYGIYLHALQDSFSHRGYNRFIGHVKDSLLGKDPDSLASDPAKSKKMAQTVVSDMLEVCGILKRQPRYITSAKDPVLDNVMNKLIANSNPRWKNIDAGEAAEFLVSPGKKILEEVLKRLTSGKQMSEVEKVIQANKNYLVKELRKIPNLQLGNIYPPISLEIDRQGNPVLGSDGFVKIKSLTTDPSDLFLTVRILDMTMTDEGLLNLSVVLEVFNSGDNATSENLTLALLAMDSSENILSRQVIKDAPLQLGESREYASTLLIDTRRANFSDENPVLVLFTVYGGPEDPDYSDNGRTLLLVPGLVDLASEAQKVLKPVEAETVTLVETATRLIRENSTVTLTVEKTVTIAGVNETVTSFLESLGVEINAENILLALIALLIIAAIIRLLRR